MDCAVFLADERLIATALAIVDSIKPLLNQLIDSVSASLTGGVGSFDDCGSVSIPVVTVRLGIEADGVVGHARQR